jgi:hypothetical protein
MVLLLIFSLFINFIARFAMPIAKNLLPFKHYIKGKNYLSHDYMAILNFTVLCKTFSVVIGTPIEVPKTDEADMSQELIDKYHNLYLEGLTSIYQEHKDVSADFLLHCMLTFSDNNLVLHAGICTKPKTIACILLAHRFGTCCCLGTVIHS